MNRPSSTTRFVGAVAALVVTLTLLQSVCALFDTVPARQLAQAAAGPVRLAANTR